MKEILQGTDGIRGYIEVEKITQRQNPIQIFEQKNILTPEFFELYSYCFCLYLQKRKLVKEGDYIMVGKDTRDASLVYTNAVMDGVAKAKMKPRFLDVVPTPLVAFYMVKRNRAGALVVTASHNPDDQIGIKLFITTEGLKLLPEEEKEFTKLLYETPYPITENKLENKSKNLNKKSIKKYSNYILKNISQLKYPKTNLMIDCSNGAVTGVLQKVFQRIKFEQVQFFCVKGRINENCGITQLEGKDVISLEDMEGDSIFSKNKLLQAMFKEGQNNPKIAEGQSFLSGFIFDGDGDRFMRAEYNFLDKKIYLLTGDKLAFHFLTSLQNKKEAIHFYNTIESDLEVKIFAEQNNWKHNNVPVGDRWLLKKANETKENFTLGYEESGHFIFPTKVRARMQRTSKIPLFRKQITFFGGDAILTGLKSLEVIFQNCGKAPTEEFFQKLTQQYPSGIMKNLSVYWVDKNILEQKDFIQELNNFMRQKLEELLDSSFSIQKESFANNSDLHYWNIKTKNEIQGAIFVRNSGTEDKSTLYLRGKKKYEDKFTILLEELQTFLLQKLKRKDSEEYLFSLTYLKAVLNEKTQDPKFLNSEAKQQIEIIRYKEKLVSEKKGKLTLSNSAKTWLKQ